MDHNIGHLAYTIELLKHVASNIGVITVADRDEQPRCIQVALTSLTTLRTSITDNWNTLSNKYSAIHKTCVVLGMKQDDDDLAPFDKSDIVAFIKELAEKTKQAREWQGAATRYSLVEKSFLNNGYFLSMFYSDDRISTFINDLFDKANKWDESQKSKPKSKGSRK